VRSIKARKKSLSNLIETTENAQFHKCRIEIKRLRYLSEIFGGGFGGKFFGRRRFTKQQQREVNELVREAKAVLGVN